jgi:hypothetical protein
MFLLFKKLKMKKIFFLILMLISTSSLFAQKYSDLTIEWSEEIKNKGRLNNYMTIKDHIYILGFQKNKIFMDKFSNDLNHLSRIKINDYMGKEESFHSVTSFNNQIVLFTTSLSDDKKEKTLWLRTYDTDKNQPDIEKMRVTKVYSQKKGKKIGVDFIKSLSQQTIAFVIHYPNKNKEKESIGIFVFNQNFELKWKKNNYEINFPEKEYFIKDYAISDFFEFSIIGSVWVKKDRDIDSESHNDYEIISFKNNGAEEEVFKVDYDSNIYINDFKIGYDKNSYLNAIGFYSKKNRGGADGAFILTIDMINHEVIEFKKNEFELEFITQGFREKKQNKVEKRTIKKNKDYELSNLDLDKIILCDDGSFRIIGEQFYVYTTTTTDANGNVRTQYHYVYNDIIVIKVNANKEFEWHKKIIKRQDRTSTLLSSYSVIESGGELFFLYNDHIDNNIAINPKKGYKNFSFKKKNGVVSIVEIDRFGNSKKEILMALMDYKRYFVPMYSSSKNKHEMIMCGEVKGKGYFLGKLNVLQ